MERHEAMVRAGAAYREARKQAGLKQTKDPLERLAEKRSPQRAIVAKCWDCQGRDVDPGVRWRIGNCEVHECPLYDFRPHRRLQGAAMPRMLVAALGLDGP